MFFTIQNSFNTAPRHPAHHTLCNDASTAHSHAAESSSERRGASGECESDEEAPLQSSRGQVRQNHHTDTQGAVMATFQCHWQ